MHLVRQVALYFTDLELSLQSEMAKVSIILFFKRCQGFSDQNHRTTEVSKVNVYLAVHQFDF